jgi:hypothetical protein
MTSGGLWLERRERLDEHLKALAGVTAPTASR